MRQLISLAANFFTGLLLVSLAACGGYGDTNAHEAKVLSSAEACALVNGKTLGGAALVGALVPATGAIPTYCKVTGTLAPKLNFEIRLPDSWNGKLYYGGGGGYNGSVPGIIGRPWTLAPLVQGYAMVGSDSGHQGSALEATFALNDPYAAQLFGSLSVPTVMATAIETVTAAYGRPPAKSYFEGCSNGGREALMNVQRYPNLFDGVIARAPAYNWVGWTGANNRTAKIAAAPGGSINEAKVALIAQAVRGTCDQLDGIVDGVVSNQAACNAAFNPAALRCSGGADTGNSCLSDAQLAVVDSITTDFSVVANGTTYRNAGWKFTGNEDDPVQGWRLWMTGTGGDGSTATLARYQDTTIKNYLARDPAAIGLNYTPYDQDPSALFTLAALNDATQMDIRNFTNGGRKLIIMHGLNDHALSPATTVEYYNGVKAALGDAATAAAVRFYLAPGVNHCLGTIGGPGADTVDLLTALDDWVMGKSAPATLIARKLDPSGATTFERPLCQYPQYPHYIGAANDPNAAKLATNYVCRQ